MRKDVSRIPERLRAVFADDLARRIVTGGGDNVVLDSTTDRLIA